MSHLRPSGIVPASNWFIAARILASTWSSRAMSGPFGSRGGGRVDLRDDASCAVERGLGTCAFGFGKRRVAEEEGPGGLGVVGPDLSVLGMVGCLGAARRVA